MKLKFNKTYFLLTIILFTIEVLIALFLKSGFIRHTFGDYLVVILIYCFFKSFISNRRLEIAISVLFFSFLVEFLQLIHILEILNLGNSKIAKIILGSTFHTSDLVAYTFGIISTLLIEHKIYHLWKS